MIPPTITIRVMVAGVESVRVLTLTQRFRGVSVRDAEVGGIFGVDVMRAVEELCRMHEWEFVGYVPTKAGDQ